MASRKRKSNESFQDYRLSLKREAYKIKVQALGRLIYNSAKGPFIRDRSK